VNEPVRLNKYLAHQLGISRREADDFISSGRVKLNDTHATLGSRMNPGDTLTVDDRPIESKDKFDYYLLHKPTGYVCSRRRQGDTPTIYELFPESLSHLKPVGRLDKDSSGILVMTDDGDFAHQMTHPKFQKTKVYEVTLDHPLEPLHQQMISDYGVTLEDGVSKFIVSKSTPAAGGSARGSTQNSLPEANILGADAEPGPVDSERTNEIARSREANGADQKTILIGLLRYHLELYDEYSHLTGRPFDTLKRFFKIYVREFEGASELRDRLMHTKNTAEVRAVLDGIHA